MNYLTREAFPTCALTGNLEFISYGLIHLFVFLDFEYSANSFSLLNCSHILSMQEIINAISEMFYV